MTNKVQAVQELRRSNAATSIPSKKIKRRKSKERREMEREAGLR